MSSTSAEFDWYHTGLAAVFQHCLKASQGADTECQMEFGVLAKFDISLDFSEFVISTFSHGLARYQNATNQATMLET